jgi:hypothetical protein
MALGRTRLGAAPGATLHNVLLIVGLLAILFVGGCAALVAIAVNEFDVYGFEYRAWWTLDPDDAYRGLTRLPARRAGTAP